MKYKKLEGIVEYVAEQLKIDAAYSGAHNDGGKARLLSEFREFQYTLVVKYDLRPSEYYKLDNMDVGVPENFSSCVDRYKQDYEHVNEEQDEETKNKFFKWFYAHADFGPAHGDVMKSYYDSFLEETGTDIESILGLDFEE